MRISYFLFLLPSLLSTLVLCKQHGLFPRTLRWRWLCTSFRLTEKWVLFPEAKESQSVYLNCEYEYFLISNFFAHCCHGQAVIEKNRNIYASRDSWDSESILIHLKTMSFKYIFKKEPKLSSIKTEQYVSTHPLRPLAVAGSALWPWASPGGWPPPASWSAAMSASQTPRRRTPRRCWSQRTGLEKKDKKVLY